MTTKTGMTVAEQQRALIALGYYVGKAGPDGDAGRDTIAAMTAFQITAGLVPDGVGGDLTQAALGAALSGHSTAKQLSVPTPPWLVLANHDDGVKEDLGKGSNPVVLAYYRDAGFAGVKDDAVSWCAAAVGAWLERSGFKPSGSLAARSYEGWGVGLKTPLLGCVGVKKRPGAEWQGHVGFVVGASASQIFLRAGNQGDAVSVAAFSRAEFTAFRWPSGYPIPTEPATLPTTIAGAKRDAKQA